MSAARKIIKFVERILYDNYRSITERSKKYVNKADENSLRRVYAILEIDQSGNEWWKDKEFVAELDRMDKAMESGKDKGVTWEQIEISIEARRREIYGA